jgi:ribonuclease E
MESGFEDESGEADTEEVEDLARDEPAAAELGDSEGEQGDGRRRRRRRRRSRRGDAEGADRQQSERPRQGGGQPRYANDTAARPSDNVGEEYDDAGHHDGDVNDQLEPHDDEPGSAQDAETQARGSGDTAEEGNGGGRRGRRRRRGRRGGRRGQERSEDAAHSDEPYAVRNAEAESHATNGGSAGNDAWQHRETPSVGEAEAAPTWQPVEVVSEPRHIGTPVPEVVPSVSNGAASHETTAPIVEPIAVASPQPEPERITAPEEPAVPAPQPAAARLQPVASEPVLAHVVVGPDNAVVESAQDAQRPARRGWWQRK